MQFQRQLSNGQWSDDSRIEMFVQRAAEYANRSKQEIFLLLEEGAEVKYDGDWYAMIRYAPNAQKPRRPDYAGRQLACGCVVFYASDVMTTARGTSCEKCYDRMSN